MAGMLYSESEGSARRRKEKQASAALRAKTPKSRQKFDDQSSVDKIYRWIKRGIKYIEEPFPAQVKGGTYTHQEPRD